MLGRKTSINEKENGSATQISGKVSKVSKSSAY